MIKNFTKNIIKRIIFKFYARKKFDLLCYMFMEKEIQRYKKENDFRQFGFKLYSQTDEDGIIEEIFKTLKIENGFFLEIGCGNGVENNTHYLLLKGWSGTWVDGDKKNIKHINKYLSKLDKLKVICEYVKKDNFQELSLLKNLKDIDFLSLDIDSNDYEILSLLLNSLNPKVLCVEYNAKLGSSSVYKNNSKVWKKNDYQGASFSSLMSLCEANNYSFLCSTISGVNLFFIHDKYFKPFKKYTISKPSLPKYFLADMSVGHEPSLEFLAQLSES